MGGWGELVYHSQSVSGGWLLCVSGSLTVWYQCADTAAVQYSSSAAVAQHRLKGSSHTHSHGVCA